MLVWIRDSTHCHIRVEPKETKMGEEVYNPPFALESRCYLVRTAQPSCIRLPHANGNNFELKYNLY